MGEENSGSGGVLGGGGKMSPNEFANFLAKQQSNNSSMMSDHQSRFNTYANSDVALSNMRSPAH